uniref:Ribonuclease H-like domain-containing protein n=1 Tax=Tanacetum cinerariifolium TaxID=118510 RepID=A0A699L3I6_TANCI|nr:ribonuclease H-like domain-containing protein [Tanacetum cinerariifolium]
MKPFGCPVTILNTIDHLGKFDGKADEGFFVDNLPIAKHSEYSTVELGYSKDSSGDGFKPSREKEKNNTEGPENEETEAPITEEPRVNQKNDSVNSTNRVNPASNEVNVISIKSSIELLDDPNMPDLDDISIFENSNEDIFGAEADLNNMKTTFQVSLDLSMLGLPSLVLLGIENKQTDNFENLYGCSSVALN